VELTSFRFAARFGDDIDSQAKDLLELEGEDIRRRNRVCACGLSFKLPRLRATTPGLTSPSCRGVRFHSLSISTCPLSSVLARSLRPLSLSHLFPPTAIGDLLSTAPALPALIPLPLLRYPLGATSLSLAVAC
jgi:hypothetical protein